MPAAIQSNPHLQLGSNRPFKRDEEHCGYVYVCVSWGVVTGSLRGVVTGSLRGVVTGSLRAAKEQRQLSVELKVARPILFMTKRMK